MLRKWPFRHPVHGEEAPNSLRVHDERIHALRGRGIRLEVRHVRAGPFDSVPADQLAFRVPRLAGWIARGAVVFDAAVWRAPGRPGVGRCLTPLGSNIAPRPDDD